MTNNTIDSFRNQYAFLSNFYTVSIIYEGILYNSVEHAYQASKSFDYTYRHKISTLPPNKAGIAKIRGQAVKKRADWQKVNIKIMKQLLYKKFMFPNFSNLLLQTGDKELVEENTWHDNFWGNCKCKKCKDIPGENTVGKLLMEIRKELKGDFNVDGS